VREDLTVTLTADDLDQIEEWYESCAWESATRSGSTEGNAQLKALLEKLGIEMNVMDVHRTSEDVCDPAT